MINLTIKACFISKHMSFFFCTLPYKMSINTYWFFLLFFLSVNRLLFETQIWVTVFAASYTQKISVELLLDQNTGRYCRNPTSRIQISRRSISPTSVFKNARSNIRFLANCFNQSCQEEEEEYFPRSPKLSFNASVWVLGNMLIRLPAGSLMSVRQKWSFGDETVSLA